MGRMMNRWFAPCFVRSAKEPLDDEYVLLEPANRHGNLFMASVFVGDSQITPITRFPVQLDSTRDFDSLKDGLKRFVDVSAVKWYYVHPMTPRRHTEFDFEKLDEVVSRVKFAQAVLWLR